MLRIVSFAVRCCALAAPILAAANSVSADPEPKPVQTNLQDQVRVQMKLIDAIVVDEQGRTVPALAKDDFELTLDGVPVGFDSFDVQCVSQPIADVRAVGKVSRRAHDAPDVPRKIVVVVDYPHLLTEDRRFVLEDLERVVRFAKTSREEIMIVALVGRVVLEQRFTADGDEVLSSLRRMDHDVSLWLPHYEWTTANDFFQSLAAVLDALSFEPGPKSVVLYSKIHGSPESVQERLRQIAASAQEAQATIYPVYVPGFGDFCFDGCPLLARLASDTGGQLYYRTQDLTIGYARAQRDSGCRYTFGFYTRVPADTRVQRIAIVPRRSGLKVIYPGASVTRSSPAQRRSWLTSAFYFPEGFQSPHVSGQIYLRRPKTRHTWETTLAATFPAPKVGSGDESRTIDFGGVLFKGNTPVHTFDRRLTIRPKSSPPQGDRRITFLQSLDLSPGAYTLTLVIEDPSEDRPVTAKLALEIPKIPSGPVFLIAPNLERRADADLVLRADTTDPSRDRIASGDALQPLVLPELAGTQTLIARTVACGRSGRRRSVATTIDRRLRLAEGTPVRTFDPMRVGDSLTRELSCQEIRDTLPGAGLDPGDYVFEAGLDGVPESEGRSVQAPFTVHSP